VLERVCHKMISHLVLSKEGWWLRLNGKPTREVWQFLPTADLNSLSVTNTSRFIVFARSL